MATIDGTENDDNLNGTDGADTIRGFEGNDTIGAGGGDDIVEGNDGDDHILGGDGNDEIWSGFGADEIDGGAGDDLIRVNQNRDGSIGRTTDPLDYVFGGDGNDTIITLGGSAIELPFPIFADGGNGHDTIRGGFGDDTLMGGEGNDTISGQVGDDVIDGGAGNDDLIWGDVSFGGSGNAQLIGGIGNDVLRGGLLMASMDGGEGDDRLVLGISMGGGDGPPTLDGGVGFDTLDMGRWNGQGAGKVLDLTLDDGPALAGIERIALSLDGTLIVDRDSLLSLSTETDTVIVDGDASNRVIVEGAFTAAGTETVNGQTYARYEVDGATLLVNTQIGTQPGESNTISGTAGDDTLFGTDSDDTITGGAGSDMLFGNEDDDTLHGGDAGDLVPGDGGDILDGGAGNDLLNGGAGSDTYVFRPGYDQDRIYWFEDGLDKIDLRSFGFDTFAEFTQGVAMTPGAEASGASNLALDFGGGDTLFVVGVDALTEDDLMLGSGIQWTGTEADEFQAGTASADLLVGNGGSDALSGGDGDDALHGGNTGDFVEGDGGDILDGGAGSDLLNGGFGADTFVYRAGYGQDTIYWFEDGTDRIDLRGFGFSSFTDFSQSVDATAGEEPSGAANLTLDFGNGDSLRVIGIDSLSADDVILSGTLNLGSAGNDSLTGTSGSDMLIGDAGSDVLSGGGGDDTLHGGSTGDFLAGDGGDVLDGGAGDDLLNGGAGADTFVYGPGYGEDSIYWFEDGIDRIDLSGFGFEDTADLQANATITEGTFDSGASFVEFDFGGGDILSAAGLTLAGMSNDDFLF